MFVCIGLLDSINSGLGIVKINGKFVVWMGDSIFYGGKIVLGNLIVLIGG